MTKRILLAALLLVGGFATAQAGPVGSQGFADTGAPTVDTGNINTATIFNIGDLVTNGSQDGLFVGMPSQTIGAVSFNVTVGTSLTFGNAAFGSFTSTTITDAISSSGFVDLYILGNWTPGTYGGASGGPYTGSFNISFTQTPAGTGSISDSSTFSVPPAAPPGVPEPSTLIMGLTAVAASGLFALRRRSAKAAA